MGRWTGFTSVGTNGLQDAIEDCMREYGDLVYEATEEGLSEGEKVLVSKLKDATPGSPPHKRNFKKNWKGTGKKYKLHRYVGNTTTVTGRNGEAISLANIFEYSATRGQPFIKNTFESNVDNIAAAVVAKIKEV